MICEFCKNNEANVHLVKVSGIILIPKTLPKPKISLMKEIDIKTKV